jgi:predicted phosphatase
MKAYTLPHTDSIHELAEFWDTHDLTDFDDQLEEVAEPVFERKTGTVVEIHLQPDEVKEVGRLARSKGVPKEVLLREWILQRLHE